MNIDLSQYIALANAAATKQLGDYDGEDGLLVCGKCNTPKQCRVKIGASEITVGCSCDCAEAAYYAERAAEKERQKQIRIRELRANELQDTTLTGCTFAADDGKSPKAMRVAKWYVDNWERVKRENVGLAFWGGVGNGKSFAAACIANALMEKGVPLLMTSMDRILNAVQSMRDGERLPYLAGISRFDLLILDDFGAERDTSYALETVYAVIDERVKREKPLIVTTNLTKTELQNPPDMKRERIYSRVLQLCTPVVIDGQNRRTGIAVKKRDELAAMLSKMEAKM